MLSWFDLVISRRACRGQAVLNKVGLGDHIHKGQTNLSDAKGAIARALINIQIYIVVITEHDLNQFADYGLLKEIAKISWLLWLP